MPLSWNEIRSRAIAFSKEFEDESSEDAEAKTFWDSFFEVFGMTRRRLASFEKPVQKSDGRGGYIDLLWKGVLLVEHKSRGKDLDRAFHQATDYFYGLKERDLPRYVLVSDFARFRLYDLEEGTDAEFPLKDLQKNIKRFGFIAGYQPRRFDEQEEAANIKAAEQLGKLHDQLKATGYVGHPLEVLLVRLLFCVFADDTGIFEKNQCKEYLEQRTAEDGSDLGMHLAQLFQVLNTPTNKRQRTLDELLAEFTYINGRLFEEILPIPAFDKKMRDTLLDSFALDWSRISPAIFGSLFQSIMDAAARRNLGAHYTRESNILKALRPLFLDDLAAELVAIGNNRKRLEEFQRKLSRIRVLDPACGCGNFLVIAYRELRRLEIEVLHRLYQVGQSNRVIDVKDLVYVDVDQFYGIEIEEFPAQIAQVALWLTDHQMNQLVSEEFGQYFARLPLTKAPNIVNGNALQVEWSTLVEPSMLSYIVGNPPFIGKKEQTPAQKAEVMTIFAQTKGAGVLDYVSCWYRRSVDVMERNPNVQAALVSTNSITQGEQVGVLWGHLLARGVQINFAHRTFQWSSEAKGKAAVQCVIIGFARHAVSPKHLFDYDAPDAEPHSVEVSRINPYLVDAPTVLLVNRRGPLSTVPDINYGSFALDDGNYTLSEADRSALLAQSPEAEKYLREFVGGQELLHGEKRWCLWLQDTLPGDIRRIPAISQRVAAVKAWRQNSDRTTTRALAATPALFAEVRQPSTTYLAMPTLSSEKRTYIPIAFLQPEVVASNQVYIVPNATLYHFGVLESQMHMAWVRAVCGRLESRYRYSAGIVYNNFPWPTPTTAQEGAIVTAAQEVLDVREKFKGASLAQLYDPLAMPGQLVKAHQNLDRAVEASYRKSTFKGESERVAFLFERYQEITAPLDVSATGKGKGRRRG